MQAAPFEKLSHSKMDNWKYGLRNPKRHDLRAVPTFTFCGFMGMQIARSVGPLKRPRCGASVQSKFGE